MTKHPACEVADASTDPVGDDELERLIHRVYVDGGFTRPDVAATLFAGAAIRRRGRLLFLRDPANRSLVGTVIVVPPGSPARRIATEGEVEMQLLAVSQDRRNEGIGQALVDAALKLARQDRYSAMVLWTQTTMHAAQRLYERAGFVRAPERDVEYDGRTFLVYQLKL